MDRPFTSDIPAPVLDAIQNGTSRTVYRGVSFLKSPFDVVLYLQLLHRLQPRTVIEIGSKHGGSALWFADMMSAQGVTAPRIVSVDIRPLATFTDERITFLTGNARNLGPTLTPDLLANLPRPWLVIEDSAHTYDASRAVLDFFHPLLVSGDYIVVEDGVVSQLSDPLYASYEDGPNRAVADVLALHPSAYAVDTDLCDHFGRNATYNPNGWLRRI